MKVAEAQGYSKEKALNETNLDVSLDKLKNATLKWKKAGSPINSRELTKFMESYLKENKKNVGAYIVVEPSADDTRLRPYTVINETTTGKRRALTSYQIKEGEAKVTTKTVTNDEGEEEKVVSVNVMSLGAVEAKADKKDMAIRKMKELIEANKKDYVIEIVKEIVDGQKYAAYGFYTPSKSAKKGKFIFFLAD